MGFLKDAVNRADGTRNAEMDGKVINFYRFVATYSPKAAMVVSENRQGPGNWWMQKLNAQDRISFILDDDHKIIVSRMRKAAADRAIDDKTPVVFSLAIDATKVAKVCERSLPPTKQSSVVLIQTTRWMFMVSQRMILMQLSVVLQSL